MISELVLQNFKLYETNKFDNLTNLNILTGKNGRGKSSFLQSLLLISQSLQENSNNNELLLNGSLVNIGTASDIKNSSTSRITPIKIGFRTTSHAYVLAFNYENEQSINLEELDIKVDTKPYDARGEESFDRFLPKNISDEAKKEFNQNFDYLTYISAERIGPQLHYPNSVRQSAVGTDGKYVACALYRNRDLTICKEFIEGLYDIYPEITEELDTTLLGITQFWLSKLFGKTQINSEFISQTNEYTLQFSTLDNLGKFKPTNVGYGYSYALPIIVGGLLARKGSIFIVENPEAHLHPHAQSTIGKFLSLLSQTGVQVFVETHSEHIINAVRVLTVQEAFENTSANIMYFTDDTEEIKRIPIDERGRIECWPEGFMDQEELDLDIIHSN